jgi:hypothetical protein
LRSSKYRMDVEIKPLNPFVPNFQIFSEKEEVQAKIKPDNMTNREIEADGEKGDEPSEDVKE